MSVHYIRGPDKAQPPLARINIALNPATNELVLVSIIKTSELNYDFTPLVGKYLKKMADELGLSVVCPQRLEFDSSLGLSFKKEKTAIKLPTLFTEFYSDLTITLNPQRTWEAEEEAWVYRPRVEPELKEDLAPEEKKIAYMRLGPSTDPRVLKKLESEIDALHASIDEQLQNKNWSSYNENVKQLMRDEKNTTIVAINEDHEAIGYCIFRPDGSVPFLAVHAQYQSPDPSSKQPKLKVGTNLLLKTAKLAKEQGIEKMRIEYRAASKTGVKTAKAHFYSKIGEQILGRPIVDSDKREAGHYLNGDRRIELLLPLHEAATAERNLLAASILGREHTKTASILELPFYIPFLNALAAPLIYLYSKYFAPKKISQIETRPWYAALTLILATFMALIFSSVIPMDSLTSVIALSSAAALLHSLAHREASWRIQLLLLFFGFGLGVLTFAPAFKIIDFSFLSSISDPWASRFAGLGIGLAFNWIAHFIGNPKKTQEEEAWNPAYRNIMSALGHRTGENLPTQVTAIDMAKWESMKQKNPKLLDQPLLERSQFLEMLARKKTFTLDGRLSPIAVTGLSESEIKKYRKSALYVAASPDQLQIPNGYQVRAFTDEEGAEKWKSAFPNRVTTSQLSQLIMTFLFAKEIEQDGKKYPLPAFSNTLSQTQQELAITRLEFVIQQ